MKTNLVSAWTATPLRLAAVAVIGAALVFTVGFTLAERHAQHFVLRVLSARAGRDIRVAGDFELHLLARHPTLKADQVTIDNPAWMQPRTLARIAALQVDLQWHLSMHPLSVGRLEVEGAELNLVRNSDGRANWHRSPENPGPGLPLISSLYMPDARVELHDERRHLQFSGNVSAQDRRDDGSTPHLEIKGHGMLNGRSASLAITGEPLASARSDRPYHFSLQETSGAARLTGQGQLERPFDPGALQARFEMTGPDMSQAYFLVGLHLPATGVFRLSGSLKRQRNRFFYRNLEATSGVSDLGGALTVDSSSGRPRIEGQLTSRVVRLADIGKAAAGYESLTETTAPLLASENPLPLTALTRTDWRVTYHADEVQAASQALRSVTASLSIQRGVLRLDRVAAVMAGGSIAAEARLDASASPPRAALEVSVRDLQLEQFAHGPEAPPYSGPLSGRLRLSGEGKSIHDLLSTATGKGGAVPARGHAARVDRGAVES